MNQYIELKEQFEKNRNPENARQMSAYMKNLFLFYGLKAPERRALSKELLKEAKKDKSVDWNLLNQCYEDDYRELQYFVIDYLKAMQKFLSYEDIPRIQRYVKEKQWWDTIDALAGVIGKMALVDQRMNDMMVQWSTDEDFWVRRIAIIHQLNRKEKTDPQLLKKILVNNFGSSEFFINKAIGWSLRDYSKTNPDWVRDFLETHRDQLAALSIREASKYL